MIEQIGVTGLIEQADVHRVIGDVRWKKVINEVGVDEFLAALSPAQRREFKKRLLNDGK